MSVLEASTELINPSWLMNRICVQKPYFALQRLAQWRGKVHADVKCQHPLGLEVGPITGAEAGRHLAILGLCAAAVINPNSDRHFYLAHRAEIKRGSIHSNRKNQSESLKAVAQASFLSKREAVAETFLYDSIQENLVYTMGVRYQVLSEKTFQRLYSRGHQLVEGLENPYSIPLEIRHNVVSPDHIQGQIDLITPSQCLGHFSSYPALPVARVMQGLTDLAGKLLNHRLRTPSQSYAIKSAQVEAESLAFAGESLHYRVNYVGSQDSDHFLNGTAIVPLSNRKIGAVQLVLST